MLARILATIGIFSLVFASLDYLKVLPWIIGRPVLEGRFHWIAIGLGLSLLFVWRTL